MKKINVFILSILILTAVAKPSFAFSDTTMHWANDTIEKMKNTKIITGYKDDTFRPDSNMTRAEFVTVINRMLDLQEESSKYIPDINRSNWYYSEIRKAVKVGIIQGDSNGATHPEDNITREEAIVILSRAFKLKKTSSSPKGYDDIENISEWAQKEVFSAIREGYITGYADNTIKPQNFITRAEALTMINRMIPNILTTNVYTGLITGNTLIYEDNIVLNNLTIDGNLIISNKAMGTLKVKDVTVKKNLIVQNKEHETLKKLNTNGNIYEFSSEQETVASYRDEQYGISFTIPESVTVKFLDKEEEIDYKIKDLLVISVEENEDNYLKNITTISDMIMNRYDNLYKIVEEGKFGFNDYQLYVDNYNNHLFIIKRDNHVYIMRFYNVQSQNLVDNVIATFELFETETITDSKVEIYKNNKLSLKFSYLDRYVSVDDSYNTGNINEDKKFFKLFIQVNTITDMQEYSLAEIKALLTAIVSEDGEVKETQTFKIMGNNAIKYKIESEEKMIYSLYVVIGNNLYNLIFTGDEEGMIQVGEEMFDDIVKTLEF